MSSEGKWRVFFADRELPEQGGWPELLQGAVGYGTWLTEAEIPEGTPFLLAPDWSFDTALNSYFLLPDVVGASWHTNAARARALEGFFTFLWRSRGETGWRDATQSDHLAFHQWRRRDAAGPQVAGATWSAEVSHVHRFYSWAQRRRLVAVSPVPVRARRRPPEGVFVDVAVEAPSTLAHDERGEKVEWLPPESYRRWRDVGVRGYAGDGHPRPEFRARWAARNAVFCDLMVRTGLRLREQSSLLIGELPWGGADGGYARFWLSAAVAKGGSARWVYVPHSVMSDLEAYVRFDRADVVADAQARRRYDRVRRPLVVEDPDRPDMAIARADGVRTVVNVERLREADRYRLFRMGPAGLEPVMLWLLGKDGMPLAKSTWKDMFSAANEQCTAAGVDLACHAHKLRHSFAVITLEQLQRGHIAALADQNEQQRGYYTRVFGDPLDWVRRRLGHASITSTLIYLHALQELEMETRMALVPDDWQRPVGQVAD